MGIFEKLSDYLARERDLAEIGAMAETDLTELGLDTVELRRAVLSRPKVREQMLAMAKRFGLSEEDIAQPYWRETDCLNTCQNCGAFRQCSRYLSGKSTEFAAFECPNSIAYAEISVEEL